MQADPVWTAVDPLGEALHTLRMSGVFYCRSEFSAPWGLELPPMRDCLMFHVLTAGRCWIEGAPGERRLLQAGDLVVLPHGEGHTLVSEPGAACGRLFELPREQLSERYEVLRLGGGGASTSVICGAVRFEHPTARHLVAMLPPLICIEAASAPHAQWLQSSLSFMAAEARELRPGGEAVVTRLADILVIQAIRAWIAGDPTSQTGWLGALQDPRIGRAMSLVHRDPAQPWSVASLAREVAMSRSAFAARFTDLVGEPVMQYVTRWRMQVALDLLRTEDVSVAALAARLGYESEAAFSRAFTRTVGTTPGASRRAQPATGQVGS
jgi:AraC-like DNA-binding protein